MYILQSSCDPCLKQEQLSRWLIQTIWKYLKFFWQSERGQEEVGEANWKIGEGGQPEQVTGWVKQFKRENCKNNALQRAKLACMCQLFRLNLCYRYAGLFSQV